MVDQETREDGGLIENFKAAVIGRPVLVALKVVLLLFEKNPCDEDRCCREQPFDPPELDRLPIEQRACSKDESSYNRRDDARESDDQRYQGGVGLSQCVA